MRDTMVFPETWEEFINNYSFEDRKEVYTNGSELIPVFRVYQMIEHYFLKTNSTVADLINTINNLLQNIKEKEGYSYFTV